MKKKHENERRYHKRDYDVLQLCAHCCILPSECPLSHPCTYTHRYIHSHLCPAAPRMAPAGETKGLLRLIGLSRPLANSRCLVKVMEQAYSDNSPDCSSQHPSICGSETSFNKIHTIFPDYWSAFRNLHLQLQMITQNKVLQLHCMFLVLSELLHADMEKSSLLPSSQREGQTEYLGSPCYLSCCTGLLCIVQTENRSAAAITLHSRKIPLWWWKFGSPVL